MGTQLAFDWRQIIHSRKNMAVLGLFMAAFIVAFFALSWTKQLDVTQTSQATANAALANYAEYNLDTLSQAQKPLLANLDAQNSATGVIGLGLQLDEPDTTRNGLLSLRTAQLAMRQHHYKALNTMPLPPLHQLTGDVLSLNVLKSEGRPAATSVSTSASYIVLVLPYLGWITGAAAILLSCDSWIERRRHRTLITARPLTAGLAGSSRLLMLTGFYILTLLAGFALMVATPALIAGLGDFNYPIAVMGTAILPLWQYILFFGGLPILAGIWLISFSMLVNTWITNVYLTAFIVMAAGLLPVMLPQLFHFLWFLPMPYLDSYATLSGTLVDRLNQPLASVVIGTGLLFLWTFVNLFIFGLRVKKEAA